MPKSAPPCPFEKVYPNQLIRDDEFYMKLAYNAAIDAWKKNEVPIGAVIECDGQIIATAHNEVETMQDPTGHAEVLAITQAANALGDWRLNSCTLYVTKEPCPMCSGAVIMSRMGRVVYAVSDPKMGCLGGATNLCELPRINHRCLLESGVYEKACMELIRTFFELKRADSDS
ncbi:MAG: nucleoside deaminase [Opitutales bacterium]|nr:nucleoside deaminase [Opitutales bacterium]